MGMENGAPIEGDLNNIQYFFDEGIRYITLAHSLSNHISDSSYDENKAHGGLSDFGRKVVRKMNEVGMMIDISHVSDDAFWEVMDISAAPAIASHSSARHFTPGWERNMSDKMIQKLAENGGLIMINYGSASASEIVAGALKDHKRAILLGENSYGKGSVQSIIPLKNDGAIRLTVAKYYLPSGKSISEVGVSPDIQIDEETDDFRINTETDNQLTYAIKLLNG